MIRKILVILGIIGCISQFFSLSEEGANYLKKESKEIWKAIKESKKTREKISKENIKLLLSWMILGLSIIVAVICLIFYPMSELESLGLIIVLVGTWIVMALDHK